MRTLLKNKQKLLYSNQGIELPIFETDSDGNIAYDGYTDDDGNFFPYLDVNNNKIPLFTGKTEILYEDPLSFFASISMSGGEAEAVEYGLSQQDFEAIALYANGDAALKEGSLVWFKSEVEYLYGGKEIEMEVNDELIKGRFVNPVSADYRVVKVAESLNFSKAILRAINK